MTAKIGGYIVLFLCCVLAQVLIFNYITLFYVAIPVVFIYFIIRVPVNLSLPLLYTFAFLLGLTVDIFSDTPGVNALACVLIAALKSPIYYIYVGKDDRTQFLVPCVATLGLIDYCKYLLTFIAIYCFLEFTIEYFSFANVKDIVILTSASTAFTFVILLAIDCLIPVKT